MSNEIFFLIVAYVSGFVTPFVIIAIVILSGGRSPYQHKEGDNG